MRLSFGMKAAINQYFAFARPQWPDMETKEHCINSLFREAKKSKLGIEVVPGTIFLSRRKQTLQINKPVRL
jgi:hypothetical protein